MAAPQQQPSHSVLSQVTLFKKFIPVFPLYYRSSLNSFFIKLIMNQIATKRYATSSCCCRQDELNAVTEIARYLVISAHNQKTELQGSLANLSLSCCVS